MLLSPQKIRWSGWLLFIGSLLSILALLVELTVAVFPIIPACASVIGGLLVAVGLPSTYIKQRDVIGILGRIGFLLLLVTWFLTMLGVNITDIVVIATVAHPTTSSIPPLIANTINLASMLMLIGTLLYGVLTLRARIFPSSVGWLMISTVIVITLSLFVASLFAQLLYAIGELLLLSAFARMGYLLARWPDDIEPEPVEPEEVGTMSD
ncbi:MAG: hypothetical protein JO031_18785 [Ktedonobacteraceae bacterium]|nr:hypothetical protein [Ktedonobacteraceae bacterium]